MDRSIAELSAEAKKTATQAIDGHLIALLQANAVPSDIQVAIGMSPCNKLAMFAEYFDSKAQVKQDAPTTFKYSGMSDVDKKANSARLALVWFSASKAAEQQAEELARGSSSSTDGGMIMSFGLREGLCKAYVSIYGGEPPSARDQASDNVLGIIYKDFAASFPACYSLESMVSYLDQRITKGSRDKDKAKDKNDDSAETRGPITNRDELRQALMILFTSKLMVVAGLPSIQKIQLTSKQSLKWVENILEELANADPHPSMKILLRAELAGRQEALKLCLDEGMVYGEALDAVRKDGAFWNSRVHLKAAAALRDQPPPPKRQRTNDNFNSKGNKGSSKGKNQSKGIPNAFKGKALQEPPTPSNPWGKKMCFDFHMSGRCNCNGTKSHLCPNEKNGSFCFEDHRMNDSRCPKRY